VKVILKNGNFSSVRKNKEYEVLGVDEKRKLYVIKNDMHSQMAYPMTAFEIIEEKVEVVEVAREKFELGMSDWKEVAEDSWKPEDEFMPKADEEVEAKQPVKKNGKRKK